MVYRVIISHRAHKDLQSIQRYIASDSPYAAARLGQLIFSKEVLLSRHPQIGRIIPEFSDETLREIIVGNYRLIYQVDSLNKTIKILRYWHAARGIPNVSS